MRVDEFIHKTHLRALGHIAISASGQGAQGKIVAAGIKEGGMKNVVL
jgi:hypothetical protein